MKDIFAFVNLLANFQVSVITMEMYIIVSYKDI